MAHVQIHMHGSRYGYKSEVDVTAGEHNRKVQDSGYVKIDITERNHNDVETQHDYVVFHGTVENLESLADKMKAAILELKSRPVPPPEVAASETRGPAF